MQAHFRKHEFDARIHVVNLVRRGALADPVSHVRERIQQVANIRKVRHELRQAGLERIERRNDGWIGFRYLGT